MGTYRGAISAHGSVNIDAADEAEAVEKLNAALDAVDTGDLVLSSLVLDFVEITDENGEDTGRWEQYEARERGVNY